jgi:hypothetical protein
MRESVQSRSLQPEGRVTLELQNVLPLPVEAHTPCKILGAGERSGRNSAI